MLVPSEGFKTPLRGLLFIDKIYIKVMFPSHLREPSLIILSIS